MCIHTLSYIIMQIVPFTFRSFIVLFVRSVSRVFFLYHSFKFMFPSSIHLLSHSFVRSVLHFHSIIYELINPTLLLFHSFIHSFVRSFVRSFICSVTHSLIHPENHSLFSRGKQCHYPKLSISLWYITIREWENGV